MRDPTRAEKSDKTTRKESSMLPESRVESRLLRTRQSGRSARDARAILSTSHILLYIKVNEGYEDGVLELDGMNKNTDRP